MFDISPIVDEINSCSKQIIDLYKHHGPPCLCVIQVGDDPASNVYVRNKTKVCENLGIKVRTICVDYGIPQQELEDLIRYQNNDKDVDAVLLQLPLPPHLNEKEAINSIAPTKDVDCLTDVNQGRLIGLNSKSDLDCVAPCTPTGIAVAMSCINEFEDKPHVVIINRSRLVGMPLANILLAKGIDATVTICHSKTKNLVDICKTADVLVVAVGIPNFLTADMVKPDALVFDVGINRVGDSLYGDVNVASVLTKTNRITPVPGGVGRLTTAMLASNTVALWAHKHDRRERISQEMQNM